MSAKEHIINYNLIRRIYENDRYYFSVEDHPITEDACEEFKHMNGDNHAFIIEIYIGVNGNDSQVQMETPEGDRLTINYCPFCGAKLIVNKLSEKIMKQVMTKKLVETTKWEELPNGE
jgi:hypothetical protein